MIECSMNDKTQLYRGSLNPYGWLMHISLILLCVSIFIACLPYLAPTFIGALPLTPIIWPILLTGSITWATSLICLIPPIIIRKILFPTYFEWLNQKQINVAFYILIAATVITCLTWCLSTFIFPPSLSGMILGIGWTAPLTFLTWAFMIKNIKNRDTNLQQTKRITSDYGSFRAIIAHKLDTTRYSSNAGQYLTDNENFCQDTLQTFITKNKIKRIYLYFGGKDEHLGKYQFNGQQMLLDSNSLFISVGYEESLTSLLLGRPYHEKAVQSFQAAHSFAQKLLTDTGSQQQPIKIESKYWLHAGYKELYSMLPKKKESSPQFGNSIVYRLFMKLSILVKIFFHNLGKNGLLQNKRYTKKYFFTVYNQDPIIAKEARINQADKLNGSYHGQISYDHMNQYKNKLTTSDQKTYSIVTLGCSQGAVIANVGGTYIENSNKRQKTLLNN